MTLPNESARHVEVLRDIQRGCRDGWRAVRTDPASWVAALDSAIRALEAKALAESGDVNLVDIGHAIESPHSVEPSDAERAAFVADWHEKVAGVAALRARVEELEAAIEAVNAGMDHAADCWTATPGPAECNCPMKAVREALGLTPEKRS
jgi:hypothetical protein